MLELDDSYLNFPFFLIELPYNINRWFKVHLYRKNMREQVYVAGESRGTLFKLKKSPIHLSNFNYINYSLIKIQIT